MKGKYLQMFGSPFVMYVCSIKHNIIINHFIRRPLNVKKLKINFFLTHFYILITIYSCHFRLFFCARFIWSRLHNDLLFLIQTRFFIMSLRMMMSEKALLMEIGRKKRVLKLSKYPFFGLHGVIA